MISQAKLILLLGHTYELYQQVLVLRVENNPLPFPIGMNDQSCNIKIQVVPHDFPIKFLPKTLNNP